MSGAHPDQPGIDPDKTEESPPPDRGGGNLPRPKPSQHQAVPEYDEKLGDDDDEDGAGDE